MNELQKNELRALLKHSVQWNCPLRSYTSFGIGGPADALVRVESVRELEKLFLFLVENQLNWRVIGRGTNLLVRDEGFAGIAIVLTGDFKEYECEVGQDAVYLKAGAGCSLTRLSGECAAQGFSGLEFTVGIPGTLGGAIFMNAGAWGGSISDVLLSLDVVNREGRKTYERDQLSFSYRKADTLAEHCVVVGAVLRLCQKKREEVEAVCRGYREKRNQLQPGGYGSAGSIFKNPEGHSAGRLIEVSGLKGMMIGDAQVSEKHANFIINRGMASAGDVLNLIAHIQEKVEKDSGIKLDPEVHIL